MILKIVFHDGGPGRALMESAFGSLLRAAMRVSAGEKGSWFGEDIRLASSFLPRLVQAHT
jgi:hypothetical protein